VTLPTNQLQLTGNGLKRPATDATSEGHRARAKHEKAGRNRYAAYPRDYYPVSP